MWCVNRAWTIWKGSTGELLLRFGPTPPEDSSAGCFTARTKSLHELNFGASPFIPDGHWIAFFFISHAVVQPSWP